MALAVPAEGSLVDRVEELFDQMQRVHDTTIGLIWC
jgi:hypothetical protein